MKASATPTVGDKLQQANDRPSGFDYLRIILALLVAASHIPVIVYRDPPIQGWPSLLAGFLLPSFFALSGFLVAGSLERCRTISAFVGLRMIRIFPALAVEVTLSALILGPLLSTLPLGSYFTDPGFRRYLLNLVGEIHFGLPGVFADAPEKYIVNAQLWTIPYELICYVLITALALAGLRKRPVLILQTTILILILYLVGTGLLHGWQSDFFNPHGTGRRTGFYLVLSFLCGLAIYIYRDEIRLTPLAIATAVTILPFISVTGGPALVLFPIAAAYLTVAIGVANPPRIWILQGADYSYGIYLYHFVIFQVVAQFWPNDWHVVVGLGFPLVILFAAFSWHLIEKPSLALKTPLVAADRGSAAGTALLISALAATAILSFDISYDLYPFFNPQPPHATLAR